MRTFLLSDCARGSYLLMEAFDSQTLEADDAFERISGGGRTPRLSTRGSDQPG